MLLSIVNEELTTPDNTEEQKKNKCKKNNSLPNLYYFYFTKN